MTRALADALHWQLAGAKLVDEVITGLSTADFQQPSELPGWSRAQLVAHLNRTTDALLSLLTQVAGDDEEPEHTSPAQPAVDIARTDAPSSRELVVWFAQSVTRLLQATDRLTRSQWAREVVTAQGSTVPVTEIPWLYAREAFVHAVDLDQGVSFADLPTDFLHALAEEILSMRGMTRADVPDGPLSDVAAWLAGRPHTLPDAPELGPWL